MSHRLVAVAHRLRHLCVRFGPLYLVVIWPLFLPRSGVPYWWLAWSQTVVIRLGGAEVIWQGKRRRKRR